MGTYLFFAVLLFLAVALSLLGLWVMRRFVGLETLKSYHEVSGPMLAMVGTLYAVVLGFIVVDALDSFQKARVLIEQEANALADVFHYGDGFAGPTRERIQQHCLDYVTNVIDDEWVQMDKGLASRKASNSVQKLWDVIIHVNPKTESEQTLYQCLLTQMGELGDCRRTRLVTAAHAFDPIIWTVLIAGGTFSIVLTYFFAIDSLRAQAFMTAIVAIILCLNMILVAMFGYPFSGDVKVYPDTFQHDRVIFENAIHNAPSGEERN